MSSSECKRKNETQYQMIITMYRIEDQETVFSFKSHWEETGRFMLMKEDVEVRYY